MKKQKNDLPRSIISLQKRFIQLFMGKDAWQRLMRFEEMLRERYDLNREIKIPFGNNYG